MYLEIPRFFLHTYMVVTPLIKLHPFSDLDIGIDVQQLTQREKLDLELALALEIDKKLKRGPASAVRIINSLPLAVAGKFITEGLLIYCRDDEARIDYETIIRSAYFDFLPFIINYQRTYLKQIAVQSEGTHAKPR